MTDFYRELIDAALEAMQRKADSAESPDDIVGHKTLLGDDGLLYHVPLTRREADQYRRCEVTAD
jgi:hypothetical protein